MTAHCIGTTLLREVRSVALWPAVQCPSMICCEKCRTMTCSEKCCTMPKVRNAKWLTITRSVYCYFEDSSYLAYGPITWFMKDSMIWNAKGDLFSFINLLLLLLARNTVKRGHYLNIYCIVFFSVAQRLVTILRESLLRVAITSLI